MNGGLRVLGADPGVVATQIVLCSAVWIRRRLVGVATFVAQTVLSPAACGLRSYR